MTEERAHPGGIATHSGELRADGRGELLAFPPRAAGVVGALGVTPHEFIGIEFGGVAGRKCSVSRPAVLAPYALTARVL